MKFNNISIITALLVLMVSSNLLAQTKFIKGEWSTVLSKATKENKLIFIDLYYTGCFPCAQMDKEVFPNKQIGDILNNDFVSFKSDILKETIGKKLSMKFGVSGFPSFVIMNTKGHVLDVSSSFRSIEQLTELLENAKTNNKNKVYKKYSTSLELNYPDFYKNAYMNGKRRVSFEQMDAYLKEQPSLGDEIPYVIMTGLRTGGRYADYYINNAEALAKNYGRIQVRTNLISLITGKAKRLGYTGDKVAFEKIIEKAKKVFTTEEWNKYSDGFYQSYKKATNSTN